VGLEPDRERFAIAFEIRYSVPTTLLPPTTPHEPALRGEGRLRALQPGLRHLRLSCVGQPSHVSTPGGQDEEDNFTRVQWNLMDHSIVVSHGARAGRHHDR
jgi:hypothetical protein